MPGDLAAQLQPLHECIQAMGWPMLIVEGVEADDVIGTLATKSSIPVDIVTGDRDLFQLVDDARGVRVIYTARGMSNLEVVTDAVVVSKYGVLPSQYADFATMRGDASDGLPGVAGVGEKTAATLLQTHGDLSGIRAAAEAGEGMSAGVRAKVLAASAYLDVAPTVVEVARSLDIEPPLEGIRALDPSEQDVATALAEKWNLGGSMARAVAAVATIGD
jgi:5'-3' exonuclease